MKRYNIDLAIQAAKELERLAALHREPNYQVREYITLCPKDFDSVTWVNENCETASYVEADGVVVFKVILP